MTVRIVVEVASVRSLDDRPIATVMALEGVRVVEAGHSACKNGFVVGIQKGRAIFSTQGGPESY